VHAVSEWFSPAMSVSSTFGSEMGGQR
jgi:hypothetical protein